MSSFSRDQGALEKLPTGFPGLPLKELLFWGGVNKLPTLESLSLCTAIPLCFLYDFLKAAMSRKVLNMLFRSITKRIPQEKALVLVSRPIGRYSTKLLAKNRNEGKLIRGIPNYGQTCFLNSVLQVRTSTYMSVD